MKYIDIEKHEITLKLDFQSHFVDEPKVPEYLQIKFIELSEDDILKF